MPSSVVQVCIDYRLNHERIRAQVQELLDRMGIDADKIFVINEVAANTGSNFRNTLGVLAPRGEPIVFCAVLHHDDCVAAAQGIRAPLATSARQMATFLEDHDVLCPVLTGTIETETNQVIWSDSVVADDARCNRTV